PRGRRLRRRQHVLPGVRRAAVPHDFQDRLAGGGPAVVDLGGDVRVNAGFRNLDCQPRHVRPPRALARAWSIFATTSCLAIAFSATSGSRTPKAAARRYLTSCSLAATSASYISGAEANNGPHSSGASGATPATPLLGSATITISFPVHSHGPGVLITCWPSLPARRASDVARGVPMGYTDSGHACSPRALASAA